MSTIEELQQACAEFSQNFAALSAKHDALGKELEAERGQRRRLEAQLAAAAEEAQQYAEAAKAQRAGTDEALQYKERYYATCVAVEHLKGRLEVAKRALGEKDEEHEAEKGHLHAQMGDLLSRLDAGAADKEARALKDRIVQLEEQCASLSGATIEERERVLQQQILSNATVRDLQSRVASSEQRARAAEGEVAQLRGMLRRCAEVQSELTMANDRLEAERGRLQLGAEEAARAQQRLEKEAAGAARAAEERLAAAERAHEKTVRALRSETASLRDALDRKSEALAAEADRVGDLRASLSKRLNAAREECGREVEALQASKSEALAEVQRLKWRASQDAVRAEELASAAALAQQRIDGLERQLHEMGTHVEAGAQKESFLASEREQLRQTVATMQLRLAEAQQQLAAREASATEADRLRLQLQYADAELGETRRQLVEAAHKGRAAEAECEKKIKFMHKHLRAQMKKRDAEVAHNEDLRRRLVAETIYSAPSRGVAAAGGCAAAAAAAGTVPAFVPVAAPLPSASLSAASCGGPLDVLEVLRQQSQQASALQDRLSALAR